MAEAWTCSQCGTVNQPSFVVCHECGHVRPDLDRAAMAAGATDPPPDAVTGPAIPGTTIEPASASATPEPASSWTPPADWSRPTTPGGFPAGPSEGWAAAQSTPSSELGPSTAAGWGAPNPTMTGPPATSAAPGSASGWSAPGTTTGWSAPGTTTGWAPAPQRQPSILRRIPIGWVIVIVLVAAGAFAGWYLNASRSSTGAIDKAGDLNASDLRVGDCFDLKDQTGEAIGDVRAVPCTTEHTYELFFRGSMPEGDYPTDDAFDAWLTANCDPAFAAYVGRPVDQSTLEPYYLVPSSDAWGSGDRSIQCALFPSNGAHPTTSLKGSQQ